MNILLVSECEKNALTETRRIIDQFAERTGRRTWQTQITMKGLESLHKLLKRSARRNTAVACHWIKSNQTELLWVVGKRTAFSHTGVVPTNLTSRDMLRFKDENQWNTGESIALLGSIAGLFHDFGKANKLFQQKLIKNQRTSEPVRHEWVSLRLFQSFVGSQSDEQWIEQLTKVAPSLEKEVIANLIKDTKKHSPNPFAQLPPLAQVVGWLIVSHHSLPQIHDKQNTRAPRMSSVNKWFVGRAFNADWNSGNRYKDSSDQSSWKGVWDFSKNGTPISSKTWCDKAKVIAKRAQKHKQLFNANWMQDLFSIHIARLSLMFADHVYSASGVQSQWNDTSYKALANTDRKTRKPKQKLDEHNIGVGYNALKFARRLPYLRDNLPSFSGHKTFKARTSNKNFRWQDSAYDLAVSVQEKSESLGFFGVNMASTGCGKTFANARIMYGLSSDQVGRRFTIALGLRTLTLQTGDALRERLGLKEEDLAVLIGSSAVKQLHEMRNSDKGQSQANGDASLSASDSGSESAEAIISDQSYIHYPGATKDTTLGKWLADDPKLTKLIEAPILVSTIDHIMPATEGTLGGRQIAPMLRLLTSDLVLDEPDDFGLEDLPALCRLVNWAGLLGSKVLLSSATLPPSLIASLYEAYSAGRAVFNRSRANSEGSTGVCCAWFDERGKPVHQVVADSQQYEKVHSSFVQERVAVLERQPRLRMSQLIPINEIASNQMDAVELLSRAIKAGVETLHKRHHVENSKTGKKISIGLVRMANINPMVAVAKHFLSQAPAQNTRIHFCVYHSQHPMIVRSKIEESLDRALTRHDERTIWELPEIKSALKSKEENHIFVVFATAVAEVGRDHCYDWAIAEPSSMRSLIQLAGRIQRHRKQPQTEPNFLILSKNFKAAQGKSPAYYRPGFESKERQLSDKDLNVSLIESQYETINAIPRIVARPDLNHEENLVDLEHVQLAAKLGCNQNDNDIENAALWWQSNLSWNGELQRRTRFRKSSPMDAFILTAEEGDELLFNQLDDDFEPYVVEKEKFKRTCFSTHAGNNAWISVDLIPSLQDIAVQVGMSWENTCKKFTQISLRQPKNGSTTCWEYDPVLGVYSEIG